MESMGSFLRVKVVPAPKPVPLRERLREEVIAVELKMVSKARVLRNIKKLATWEKTYFAVGVQEEVQGSWVLLNAISSDGTTAFQAIIVNWSCCTCNGENFIGSLAFSLYKEASTVSINSQTTVHT